MNFITQPSQAYRFEFVESGPHIFCGEHEVQGGRCPNCPKPLLRLALLDVADERMELGATPFRRLSLFWCWTCNLNQNSARAFFYRQITDNQIALIRFEEGGVVTDFPYENYPVSFPERRFDLRPLTEKEKQAIEWGYREFELEGFEPLPNDWKYPEDYLDVTHAEFTKFSYQIGGLPYLAQLGEARLNCPECGAPMPFLAVIGDDAGGGASLSGNSFVQHVFHYCRSCFVVGAYSMVD
jgi:hypothetical protein